MTDLTLDTTTFDPMSDLFVAQMHRPEKMDSINLRTLTPFQRALLVIDGTVTKFIEAYTMEPIEIVRLGQETQSLSSYHEWLDAPEGTDVIVREVLLQGKYSYNLYAYAASLIVPSRVPDEVRRKLDVDGEGLGRILLSGQFETRREVLWYGKEEAHQLPDIVRRLKNPEFISRTYRIIAESRPIMLINEKFPYEADPLPSHH